MIKNFVRILEEVSPGLCARICYYKLSHPRKPELKEKEKAFLNDSFKSEEIVNGHTINCYQWGNGNKKALIIHGWEGKAANFESITKEMLNKNYTVVGFDAPGHGINKQKKVSFFDYSDVIEGMLTKDSYHVIITHSMGSVITLYVMDKINYAGNKMILLTTPDKFDDYIQYTIKYFGLSSRTKEALIKLIRNKTAQDPSKLNGSDFAKNISLNKVIFLHGKNDKVLPIAWTKNVHENMKNSWMYELENTGHFKILWDNQTMNVIKNLI